MINDNNRRNDFIFFQNEILGDVKKIESKVIEKVSQSASFIEAQTKKYDIKIKDLTERFNSLSQKFEEKKDTKKLEETIKQLKLKTDELITKIEVKLNILEKDFSNACFKYDKMITNNLTVPGLIGTSCPYESLKPFLNYTNIKLSELLKAKDKQNLDTKRYKEKLENLLELNKTQFETAQNKISDYCSQGFEQCQIICKDRMNLIEKRIEALRLENGQHSYDLKQKTEEIQIEWDKLVNIENNINRKYKEEWNKYNDIVDIINDKFDKFKEEFHLIKNKFTELSEFIKDVRFQRNINEKNENENNANANKSQYKEMSNRINFSKKRKTKRSHNNESKNEKDENDFLGANDIYNSNEYFKEKKNDNYDKKIENNRSKIQEKKIENKNSNNNSNIKEIKTNNNFNNSGKGMDIEKEIKNISKDYKNVNDMNKIKNHKIKFTKFNNENNLNNGEINFNKIKNEKKSNEIIMNNSSEFHNIGSNLVNSNLNDFEQEKNQDIKFINIKSKNNNDDKEINVNTYNCINYNNENNTYGIINYSNNLNNKRNSNYNEINNNNDDAKILEKRNLNENKEKNIIFPINSKINELVLRADFSGNKLYKKNEPTYNLSQAYLMFKGRSEEIQKMKKNNGGKSEQKYSQFTPSSNMTRNFNYYNNLNYFPRKDIKTKNKEDLYYSSLKKENLKYIPLNQNINLNLTHQENYENTNFPKIFKDNAKLINSNLIKNNNNKLYASYSNEGFNKNPNSSNYSLFGYNTININNENSFENKSISPVNKNLEKKQKKKMMCSFSDRNLLVKLPPFTPIYNENFSKDNSEGKNSKFKEGNAKDTLNHIKPYLINKFKDN